MNLKKMMLSSGNQKKGRIYCRILFLSNFRKGKLMIAGEQGRMRLSGCRGGEGNVTMGHKESLGGDEYIYCLGCSNGCIACQSLPKHTLQVF